MGPKAQKMPQAAADRNRFGRGDPEFLERVRNSELTVPRLRALCKHFDLPHFASTPKAELIDALLEHAQEASRTGKAAAFLFGDDASIRELSVAKDMDSLQFMKAHLGYTYLEIRHKDFDFDEQPDRSVKLQVVFACNERGRREDPPNELLSMMLAPVVPEVYGRAIIIFEEETDQHDGAHSSLMLTLDAFLEKLEQRGNGVPHYPRPSDFALPGRLHDVWTHWHMDLLHME